ncbi:MAG: DNA replication/repair protein RecF [Anaerofustis sp.]
MYVRQLRIENFRNIAHANLSFGTGYNILTGMNGQGKTNTIESICLALSGKSHRETVTENFIGSAAQTADVEVSVGYDDGTEHVVSLSLGSDRKYRIDDDPVRRRSELLRNFSVIFFSPDDLYLVKGGPSLRRNYINDAIASVAPNYAAVLSAYSKTVSQKNMLLREYSPSCKSLLEVYNESLVQYGSAVVKYRIRFLKELSEQIASLYDSISDKRERFKMTYQTNVLAQNQHTDVAQSYAKELNALAEKEIAMRTCLIGPHHDDIHFFLNGQNTRKFASQGQQRSLALSMKIALIDLFYEKNKEKPIVILDDVMSELDERRREMILQVLSDVQTFITSVSAETICAEQSKQTIFRVSGGAIAPMRRPGANG